jgi:hypothetical protein
MDALHKAHLMQIFNKNMLEMVEEELLEEVERGHQS